MQDWFHEVKICTSESDVLKLKSAKTTYGKEKAAAPNRRHVGGGIEIGRLCPDDAAPARREPAEVRRAYDETVISRIGLALIIGGVTATVLMAISGAIVAFYEGERKGGSSEVDKVAFDKTLQRVFWISWGLVTLGRLTLW